MRPIDLVTGTPTRVICQEGGHSSKSLFSNGVTGAGCLQKASVFFVFPILSCHSQRGELNSDVIPISNTRRSSRIVEGKTKLPLRTLVV